ncbi:MAG: hypothetical protein RMJ28_05540 [Nitrososphaerota archaeon]|nr:hypothetical protein [Candidatus Calditenuaceae archaeon]MDW8073676.1 hypothetical protein [Nitrososphaerota archaeon]
MLLDSTLREGELYKVLPLPTKLRVAELLVEAGLKRVEVTVDYPPRTSFEDNVRLVNFLRDRGVEVVLHGRVYRRDIEAMGRYDVYGVALYLAVSQLHLDHKLGGINYEEAKLRILEAVELVRPMGLKYVRVTYEDASRLYMERRLDVLDDLLRFTGELRSAGATLISIPDTAGLMTPRHSREFTAYCLERSYLPVAAHFHNDYGLASTNTIESILAGAAEAHVTLLGIGDRNGIADLYEVAVPLHDVHGIDLGVNRKELARIYREFSRLTGVQIPWRHPLSEEARTIRAGVHQSMVIRRPEGYIPEKKLEYDMDAVRFAVTPYMSHKLILEIARLDGHDLNEVDARRIVEEIVKRIATTGKKGSPKELANYLSEALGREVREDMVRRFFGEERAYILLKLRPQADAIKIVSELATWEEVDYIDEVYGDVDIILKGRIKISRANLVDKLRAKFPEEIEELRVLITD